MSKIVGSVEYYRGERIGRGRYGIVFYGKYGKEESGEQKDVAVKRVMKEENPYNTKLMETEILQMEHPNVIKLWCIEEDEDFM